jgi:Na+/H+ antiporter NhaD/arsenite permease-like protein
MARRRILAYDDPTDAVASSLSLSCTDVNDAAKITAETFVPSVTWVFPFAAMLLAIAILPVAVPRFWGSNLRRLLVSVALALPVVALYLRHAPGPLLHAGADYVSFVVLIGGLFVTSGGILVTGDLEATPRVNTAFLAIGATLASLIGTTGASMLLIRPLLSTNRERQHVAHTVVFFIFLVSNVGGCLTPVGDPPLFLGYLRGVPFHWTLRLWPAWLLTTAILLAVHYVWDRRAYSREARVDLAGDRTHVRPLHLLGRRNVVLLLAVVAAVAIVPAGWREAIVLGLCAVSLGFTSKHIREANRFSFHAINEVAALFLGVFVTMLPALDLLRAHGPSLHLHEPWQFFWASGLLSSFLDNAPAYAAFLTLAQSLHVTPEVAGVTHRLLTAISLGTVFMGANSYIGNGPNFMVKAIAEERGVAMPSFGRYLLYSGGILLPVFVLVTLVFL